MKFITGMLTGVALAYLWVAFFLSSASPDWVRLYGIFAVSHAITNLSGHQ